ncbi:MAG: transposase [Elusimicrobia bacterium]|nr:transposase [Elusimicrobiota bacterium]
MPRISRAVGVGLPHHITQRGNYGGMVFESDSDRERYLSLISEYALQNALSILAYCLMPNHVHFVAIPGSEYSLARVFNTAHMRYAQYINWRRGLRGHLWQGRFYSCPLDGRHLVAAARYVERNPVRAGMVAAAGSWGWSSAAMHLGHAGDRFRFDLDALWSLLPDLKRDWGTWLSKEDDFEESGCLRKNTRTGRPVGDEAFVRMMERRLGRRLHPLAVGRPEGGRTGNDCFL